MRKDNFTKHLWNTESLDQILKWYQEGKRYAHIAALLPVDKNGHKATSSAIRKKIEILLKGKTPDSVNQIRRLQDIADKVSVPRMQLKPVVPYKGKTLASLTSQQCHFVVGDPRDLECYCGEPVLCNAKYCELHFNKMYNAYQPPGVKLKVKV